MNLNDFIQELIEILREKLGRDVTVSVNNVIKNNGVKLSGIVIKKLDINAAPTIYIDNYYMEYLDGRSLDDIANAIRDVYENNALDSNFDMDYFSDYENAKDKLFCKLINYDKNKELLTLVPHRKYLDLAIVAYCSVDNLSVGPASILVRNSHANMWKVSEDRIIDEALENTRNNMNFNMENIIDTIKKMDPDIEDMEYDEDMSMLVVTNDKKIFGAIVMAFPEILERIFTKIRGCFFILPSSIHEVIIVKKGISQNQSIEEVNKIISEINRTVLSTEEVLSNHAYIYNNDKVLSF